MLRRFFLHSSACALGAMAARPWVNLQHPAEPERDGKAPPTYAVVPVVGDGKWIWKDPPKDQTGYLEPRSYELSIGIELQGTAPASGVRATTATPPKLPEQTIEDVKIETEGCEAALRTISAESMQLILAAPGIRSGQVIRAVAHYKLKLCKEYLAHEQDKFSATQKTPRAFARVYLSDSPGIQVRSPTVRELMESIVSPGDHPWEQARKFHAWVWENIKAVRGNYTNVLVALRDKKGDCEERAAVFVALCRCAGIPARLVWVPNHNWAEFWLHDDQGQGHWIPAHTSAYNWFGWTGAHELVLQKGDKLQVPEEKKPLRLLADWMQWQGGRPKVHYAAELRPVASEGETDPGPGARSKNKRGEWALTNKHPDDKYMRNG